MVLMLKPLVRGAPQAAQSADSIVAQAEARITANKAFPQSVAEAKRLKHQYGLSDQAELGLRLLRNAHLHQFLVNEEDIVKVPAQQRDQRVLQLITRIDPSIAVMVRKLGELDGGGAPSKPLGSPATPVAKASLGPRPPAAAPPKAFLGPRPPAAAKMKPTLSTETINIPSNVTVEIKARKVRVKGPRGVLLRDFKHLSLEMEVLPPLEENGPKRIRVQKWFGSTRELAAVQSVCSHINNMFTGVQRGYKYTMKLVYAHFPINVNPTDGGKSLEIRNFLGEKVIRRVPMKEGVKVDKTGNKDEIALEGNSIENVGSSASLIHQVCMVKRKDIRKFLDGVYVSEKSNIDPE